MNISKIKSFFNQILGMNILFLIIIGSIIVLLIPGNGSIYNYTSYKTQKTQLLKERDELRSDIEKKRKQLDQLKFRKDRLEKYAREQFLMKADDEDLYLLK